MGHGYSLEELEQIMNTFDTNKNGTIDWPEFLQVKFIYKWINKVLNVVVNEKFISRETCQF